MNRRRVASQVVFGDVVYGPGGMCGPRIQQDIQLVMIYSGEARLTVDQSELLVSAQHSALLLPQRRELFRFAATRQTHHSWCSVAPNAVPDALQHQLRTAPTFQPLSGRMHELVELGLSTPSGEFAAADDLLVSIGLALLQTYLFDAAYTEAVARLPDAVSRAQHYIDTHLAEPLTLAALARAASVTPQHLTRLFQRHLQRTPMRYLWQRRTRHGVELLRETGLSISEIAERCGFQSPFHFSRLVRQQYEVSPRALRDRWWRGVEARSKKL